MKQPIIILIAASFSLAAGAAPVVRLLPGPFLENMKRERAVMESLDPMNLTWMFRVTAGLDDVSNTNFVQRLGGWEKPDMELRGHTLGHWLSGMAALYEATGDASVKSRAAIAVAVRAYFSRRAAASPCPMISSGQPQGIIRAPGRFSASVL